MSHICSITKKIKMHKMFRKKDLLLVHLEFLDNRHKHITIINAKGEIY